MIPRTQESIKTSANLGETLGRLTCSPLGIVFIAAFAAAVGGENSLLAKIYTAWQDSGKTVLGVEETTPGVEEQENKPCSWCLGSGWRYWGNIGKEELWTHCPCGTPRTTYEPPRAR